MNRRDLQPVTSIADHPGTTNSIDLGNAAGGDARPAESRAIASIG
jgi:hypothetical protein